MSVSIDADKGYFIVTLEGEVTADLLTNEFVAAVNHPDFRRGMHSLWDTRKGDATGMKADDMRKIAQFIATEFGEVRKGARVAIVAATDVGFGLGRMYEMVSDGILPVQLRIFRDLATAEDWVQNGKATS